ncbi:sulfotransferase family domain-containing protein [Ditylenchus destructor]|nr:sulfotransferase family domain-containing protein [Ditylenchus destructor]
MYILYSLYSGYNNSVDREVVSDWKSNDLKCVKWTEDDMVQRETPIAAEGETSGPELLNVPDFIKKHNKDLFPSKSYFGATHSLMSICNNSDSSAAMCVPKFGKWQTNSFMVAPKSKTIACRIQKSMSTVLDAIVCYLHNEKEFPESKYSNFSTNERLCHDRSDADSLKSIVQSQNISNFEHLFQHWNVFAVVRHPIDRLLSGFLDKCIGHPIYLDTNTEEDKFTCHGCGANFTCFVISQYHRLMTQYQHPHYRITNADLHFFPQNWRCEFNRYLANISIVKYSNPKTGKYDADLFINGVMNVLEQKNNVNPQSLKIIQKYLRKSKTNHVTRDTIARQFLQELLFCSPFLMELVVRMYYWDFVLFDYPIPEINL